MTRKATVRERARELVQAGHSNICVSAVVGVTSETVRRWDRENGWRPKKPELSPLAEKRLRILVNRGWGCQTVSRQLGLYPQKLRRLMGERGLGFGPASKADALSATLKKSKEERLLDRIKRSSEQELTGKISRGEFVY